eukprot:jgi/Botrbrau1/14991/Bobra.0018s0091.1
MTWGSIRSVTSSGPCFPEMCFHKCHALQGGAYVSKPSGNFLRQPLESWHYKIEYCRFLHFEYRTGLSLQYQLTRAAE